LTRFIYPYVLPASVVKLRSVLQNAAEVTRTMSFRVGLFFSFEIYDRHKKLLYKSDAVSDHVRFFRSIYARSLRLPKPYTCRVVYTLYNGTVVPRTWSVPIRASATPLRHGIRFEPVHSKSLKKSLRRLQTPLPPWRKKTRRVWVASTLRPSPEVASGTVPYLVISNGVLTTNTVETYQTYGRVWSGVRTPSFGRLKRSQLPVNNHFSRHSRTYDLGLEISHFDTNSGPPGPFDPDFVITIRSFTAQFGTSVTGSVPPAPSHFALARNKAIKALVDRMGTGTDANLAQDLVQYRQTARTISDSVSKIASSLAALKKGNLKKATKALWGTRSPKFKKDSPPKPGASLANNWLALQYGWKPLLQDIDGTCRSLANYFQSTDAVRSVRSSASATEFSSFNLIHPTSGTKLGDATQRQHTTCKFVVRYRVASALASFLAQTGFTNPVNLAWEVLPFSFVFDWFLPIGPYLETFGNYEGLEFIDGCQTQHTRVNYLRSLSYSGTPVFPHVYEEYFGGWQRETLLLNRDALVAFPTSTFPEFKSPFDSHNQHIFNGLALIRAITK